MTEKTAKSSTDAEITPARIAALRELSKFISTHRLRIPSEARLAVNALDPLLDEIDAQQASAKLRWQADMRAIKRWESLTGKTMTWPDHADLCTWLMLEVDAIRADNEKLRAIARAAKAVARDQMGDLALIDRMNELLEDFDD